MNDNDRMHEVWTLRGERCVCEKRCSEPEGRLALERLTHKGVPALLVCHGHPVGASGGTTSNAYAVLRAASLVTQCASGKGHKRAAVRCAEPGCIEPPAAHTRRLGPELRLYCTLHRSLRQNRIQVQRRQGAA